MGSTLLKDEADSEVNKKLVTFVDQLEFINILELDNVCDHGNEILAALRKRLINE